MNRLQKKMREEEMEDWKKKVLPVEQDLYVVCSNMDEALCEEKKAQRGRDQWGLSGWRYHREGLVLTRIPCQVSRI